MENKKYCKIAIHKGDIYDFDKGNIHIGYCKSHNFMYNILKQDALLCDGKPCIYTDNRYNDLIENGTLLDFSRENKLTENQVALFLDNIANVPENMGFNLYQFDAGWHCTDLVISESNVKFEPNYEINIPSFKANFKEGDFCKKFTKALRQNGFIVRVDEYEDWKGVKYENAIAYGYGKIIGFSNGSEVCGYSRPKGTIFYCDAHWFDAWSRHADTNKSLGIDKLIEKFKEFSVAQYFIKEMQKHIYFELVDTEGGHTYIFAFKKDYQLRYGWNFESHIVYDKIGICCVRLGENDVMGASYINDFLKHKGFLPNEMSKKEKAVKMAAHILKEIKAKTKNSLAV